MCIGLAHDQIIAELIEFAALIAGDHARRHAASAHQKGETAGIVFAKTAPRVEQEFIHAVAAEARRLQGVDVGLLVEARQNFVNEGLLVRAVLAQFLGQCAGAWIAGLGQFQGAW